MRWRLVRWLHHGNHVPLALVESMPSRGRRILGFRSKLAEVRMAEDGWRWWKETRVDGVGRPINYPGRRVPLELGEELYRGLVAFRAQGKEVRCG